MPYCHSPSTNLKQDSCVVKLLPRYHLKKVKGKCSPILQNPSVNKTKSYLLCGPRKYNAQKVVLIYRVRLCNQPSNPLLNLLASKQRDFNHILICLQNQM